MKKKYDNKEEGVNGRITGKKDKEKKTRKNGKETTKMIE